MAQIPYTYLANIVRALAACVLTVACSAQQRLPSFYDAVSYSSENDEYYFFIGDKYLSKAVGQPIDGLVQRVGDDWKGFETLAWSAKGPIDAVVYNDSTKNYYFFKGQEYARKPRGKAFDPGYPRRVDAPNSGFKGMPFDRVDAAVYKKKTKTYYFFSGNQYAAKPSGESFRRAVSLQSPSSGFKLPEEEELLGACHKSQTETYYFFYANGYRRKDVGKGPTGLLKYTGKAFGWRPLVLEAKVTNASRSIVQSFLKEYDELPPLDSLNDINRTQAYGLATVGEFVSSTMFRQKNISVPMQHMKYVVGPVELQELGSLQPWIPKKRVGWPAVPRTIPSLSAMATLRLKIPPSAGIGVAGVTSMTGAQRRRYNTFESRVINVRFKFVQTIKGLKLHSWDLPSPGYIAFGNTGGYIAEFTLSYRTMDGERHTYKPFSLRAPTKKVIGLPGGATDIKITGKAVAGRSIFRRTLATPPNEMFKTYGTTGAPKWNNINDVGAIQRDINDAIGTTYKILELAGGVVSFFR